MDNEKIECEEDINKNIIHELPIECSDSDSSDDDFRTPSESINSSSSSVEDDVIETDVTIRRTTSECLAHIFNYFLKPNSNSTISNGQLVTLILTGMAYNTILRTENRTFGWRGVLRTFGLQLHMPGILKGHPFSDCKYQHTEETWEIDGITNSRHFPHSAQCDYFVSGDSKLLLNLFIIGGATIFNMIFIFYGKCIISYYLKLAKTMSLLYPLVSLYFLTRIIMDLYSDCESLQVDMFYELNKTVLPNTISPWWRSTQTFSECCGGLVGPLDWKMSKYPSSIFIYYHRSCLRKNIDKCFTEKMVNEPKFLEELWQEGCIEKEQAKILLLGIYISILLFLHGFFGTCLLLQMIKSSQDNDFSVSMDFEFNCEKLKEKVRINIQGKEIIPVLLIKKAEDMILRVNGVANFETITIVKISSIWDKLFYSKCVVCISSEEKKLAEVVITGAENTMMSIRTEKHEQCNFVQMCI